LPTTDTVALLEEADDKPRGWGHWSYIPGFLTLRHADPAHPEDDFAVDLLECHTARDVADWVLALASTRWAEPAVTIGTFVLALRDIIPVGCDSYEGPDPTSTAMLRLFDRPSV
jgi:hypothetical protein